MANGNTNPVSSNTAVSIGLVIALLGAVVTFVVSSTERGTKLEQHIHDDRDPHGTGDVLDKRLLRIESKIDNLIQDVEQLKAGK